METAKPSPRFEIDLNSISVYIHIHIHIHTHILYLYKIIFSQVDSFVLLYNYDEIIGHLMWYVCTELCQDWFLTVLFKIYIMLYIRKECKNTCLFLTHCSLSLSIRYIPFFVSLLLYYTGCFLGYRSGDHPRRTLSWWTLTVFSGVYYWYVTIQWNWWFFLSQFGYTNFIYFFTLLIKQ